MPLALFCEPSSPDCKNRLNVNHTKHEIFTIPAALLRCSTIAVKLLTILYNLYERKLFAAVRFCSLYSN